MELVFPDLSEREFENISFEKAMCLSYRVANFNKINNGINFKAIFIIRKYPDYFVKDYGSNTKDSVDVIKVEGDDIAKMSFCINFGLGIYDVDGYDFLNASNCGNYNYLAVITNYLEDNKFDFNYMCLC